MQEVIDDLLKAEAQAQQVIQAAEEEARGLKSRLENEYSQKINEAREAARKDIQRELETVRANVLAEQERILAEAGERNNSLLRDKQSLIEEVTDGIISLLITPEYEKE